MHSIDRLRTQSNNLLDASRRDPSYLPAYEALQDMVNLELNAYQRDSITLDADEADWLRFLIDADQDFFEPLAEYLTTDDLQSFKNKLRYKPWRKE